MKRRFKATIYLQVETESDRMKERGFSNGRAAQTHCRHGHPLSGENLYVTETARGTRRVCKTCVADMYQRRKAKLRGESA